MNLGKTKQLTTRGYPACIHTWLQRRVARDTEKESDSRESRDYSRTLLPWLLCAKELVLMITNKETWNAPHEIDYRLLPVGCCRSNTARLTYHNLHPTACELRNHRTKVRFYSRPRVGNRVGAGSLFQQGHDLECQHRYHQWFTGDPPLLAGQQNRRGQHKEGGSRCSPRAAHSSN